ncbi:MAG: hypothetical protein ACLRFG_01035, partial [Clostridia bacterium]
SLVVSADGDKMMDALQLASYWETCYKANLYFLLSILTTSMSGIGLLLPFGKWSYKYNKVLYFQTSEWDLLTEDKDVYKKYKHKKYKENKPYAYMLDGLIYVKEKPFYAVNTSKRAYNIRSELSWLLSAAYLFTTTMIYEIKSKKQAYMSKMDTTLGELVFSSKDMAAIDNDVTELFVDYAKNQSEENKHELLEGLSVWYNDSLEANRAELERIERYEQERDRFNSSGAKSADVYTDDKNLFAEGYNAEGSKKQYKLDEYDENTGVGSYTDESGKKVKIKNNKK